MGQCVVDMPFLLVDPFRQSRVEYVHQRDDAGEYRDLFPYEPFGISRPVEFLVMAEGHLRGGPKKLRS